MKTIVLSILVLTLVGCDASTKEFVGSSWKVTELKVKGTTVAVTNAVILTVTSESEFTLKLDANSCFGTYTITGESNIQLGEMACTEMCCDSEFSRAVVSAMHKVSNIKQHKKSVQLFSDDVQITFEKIKSLEKPSNMTSERKQAVTKGEKIPTEETTNVGKFENPNKTKTSDAISPKGEYIELYKSPCKGTCEEFTMKFYKDGTVHYIGKYNAKVQGTHTVQLAESKSESIFKEFEESNFQDFEELYDEPMIMDLQNTYVTYQGKKIHIRYKVNAPKKLQTLLEKLETQANEVLEELKKQ
ncbi:META domain-containing protein [Kordia sp. TARA_039_SRF]|nr:META domain-containing protein [Kordia sp. TARA_039_SRF]